MIQFTPTPVVVEYMARNGFILFDIVGFISQMLSADDPRSAVEQLHTGYSHGGGWNEFHGFTFSDGPKGAQLHYPGDPPMHAVAEGRLRDERVILFESSWVAVVGPQGELNVARMD